MPLEQGDKPAKILIESMHKDHAKTTNTRNNRHRKIDQMHASKKKQDHQ